MAELNLKQIIDRLNAEFVGDTRKLVFWYDDIYNPQRCVIQLLCYF